MHWLRNFTVFVLWTLLSLPGSAGAQTLTVAADPWCPFNCTPGSARPGYMVELLNAILAPQGFTVRYKLLPWVRAIEAAQNGEIGGVIAAGEEDAAKLLLHKLPFGMSSQVYVVRKGDEFDWVNADSLGQRRLEVIKGYDYGADVMGWIKRHPRQIEVTYGEVALQSGLKKLLAMRSDVVVNNAAVLRYTLQALDLPDAFTIRPTGQHVPLFVGLSPKLPDAQRLADLIDQGVARMRKSGELKQILARYGLLDWN